MLRLQPIYVQCHAWAQYGSQALARLTRLRRPRTSHKRGLLILAASSSSRTAPTADLGRPRSRIESQLPGAAPYSHWRSLADGGNRQVPGIFSRQLRAVSTGTLIQRRYATRACTHQARKRCASSDSQISPLDAASRGLLLSEQKGSRAAIQVRRVRYGPARSGWLAPTPHTLGQS